MKPIMVPVSPEIKEWLEKDWSEPIQFRLIQKDEGGYELIMRTVDPPQEKECRIGPNDTRCLCEWQRKRGEEHMQVVMLHAECPVHMGGPELRNGLQS